MRIIAFILISLFTNAVFSAEHTIPNFEEFVRAQETPATCWAAANRMLLASKGIEVSEESQLRKVFGSVYPRGAGGDFSMAQRGLKGTFEANDGTRYRVRPYVSYRVQQRMGDADWVIKSLLDGRPLVTTDGQHGYVIYGAQWQERGGLIYITGIRVIDPMHRFDPVGHPVLQWYLPTHPLYQHLIGFMGFEIESM